MFLRDKTYTILKKINDHDNAMSEQELSRHLTAVYSTDFLLRHKYIYAELSKNGNVDDANISFVIENGKAVRTKWQNDDSSPIGAYPQMK